VCQNDPHHLHNNVFLCWLSCMKMPTINIIMCAWENMPCNVTTFAMKCVMVYNVCDDGKHNGGDGVVPPTHVHHYQLNMCVHSTPMHGIMP